MPDVDVTIIEIKCTIYVMHMNHLETITTTPPTLPSVEKLSSTKPVPGAKNVGNHCLKC